MGRDDAGGLVSRGSRGSEGLKLFCPDGEILS